MYHTCCVYFLELFNKTQTAHLIINVEKDYVLYQYNAHNLTDYNCVSGSEKMCYSESGT